MRRVATGLYVYESTNRKHQGKPDVCYHAKIERKWHKIGWSSEGVTQPYAVRMRQDMVMRLRHGDMIKTRVPTMEEAWAQYLQTEDGRRDIETKTGRWNTWVSPYLGQMRMDRVDMLALEKIRSAMQDAGRKPSTVRQMLSLVRHIFNVCEKLGVYEGKNPTRAVSFKIPKNRRDRALSLDEARTLLAELKKCRGDTYLLALFSLRTGLRVGELYGLVWRDVDAGLKTVTVKSRVAKSGEKRVIPLSDDLLAELEDKRNASSPAMQDLVFPPRRRKGQEHVEVRIYPPDTFERTVEKIGLNIGVTDPRDKIVFHSLRHTYCTWLGLVPTESGIIISQAMGHSDIRQSLEYFHSDPKRIRSAVESAASINPVTGPAEKTEK